MHFWMDEFWDGGGSCFFRAVGTNVFLVRVSITDRNIQKPKSLKIISPFRRMLLSFQVFDVNVQCFWIKRFHFFSAEGQ